MPGVPWSCAELLSITSTSRRNGGVHPNSLHLLLLHLFSSTASLLTTPLYQAAAAGPCTSSQPNHHPTTTTMASEQEFLSTRTLFENAETKRRAVERSDEPATSPAYQKLLDKALSQYTRAIEQAAAVSLFSPNEAAEDLNTAALPYLLAEFHVAELVQRTPLPPGAAPTARLRVLHRARAAYDRFLALVDGYGLVGPPYDRLLDRYRDDEDAFSVVAAGGGADAAAKREAKIASYRAEKQLKMRLEILRQNPRYMEHGDEEIVREMHLTSVTAAIHATFQSLDSLNRELQLLAMAPPPLPEPQHRNGNSHDDNDMTSRLDEPLRRHPLSSRGPLLSEQGRPVQPFTLVGSRAELARGVFRPGHNLPTMSIDEYLAEERRRGNIIEGGGEQPRAVPDEDDVEAADLATYKARAWDDFTDDNPRGSGNTLNMG